MLTLYTMGAMYGAVDVDAFQTTGLASIFC